MVVQMYSDETLLKNKSDQAPNKSIIVKQNRRSADSLAIDQAAAVYLIELQ